MIDARFLQIHSLCGYAGTLLNRDDAGLAKRLIYGGALRTRISSQCLKRHWRMADGPHALSGVDAAPASVRSRDTVTRRVMEPLSGDDYDPAAITEIEVAFQKAVYGDHGAKRASRQPLLLGEPEIAYLAEEAGKLAAVHGRDPEAAKQAADTWMKQTAANMKALRASCALPGGLVSALFGRMVTADVQANIDAAVHVAHAFTVHAEESENDFFTVVDDLQRPADDVGVDHLGETELASSLFYGYVVVDRRVLLDNLGGATGIAAEVVRRLVHLIATVSPGAKRGSTAPYSYASWLLIEAGNWQPRSLAEAFRDPCSASLQEATAAVRGHLEWLDANYGTGEARRVMSRDGEPMPRSGAPVPLAALAAWAGTVVREGAA